MQKKQIKDLAFHKKACILRDCPLNWKRNTVCVCVLQREGMMEVVVLRKQKISK